MGQIIDFMSQAEDFDILIEKGDMKCSQLREDVNCFEFLKKI